MKNNLSTIGLKIIKFAIVFLIVDFSLGYLANQLYFRQKTGKQARITNVIQNASPEILIFGSSHAVRHFIPEIIEKKLEKTCYNTGVRGQGVLFTNTLQKLILKRHTPELIILNIDHSWLLEKEEFYDRLVDLYPYYWQHRDIIKPAIELNSKFIDFKLLFKSYQLNSTLAHVLKYAMAPQQDYNGYVPEVAKYKTTQKETSYEPKLIPESYTTTSLDVNFIAAYSSFITTAVEKNIPIIIFISPSLQNMNSSQNKSTSKLKSIATAKDIPLIDLTKDKRFAEKPHLFRDASHLNEEGARQFSEIVADILSISHTRFLE